MKKIFTKKTGIIASIVLVCMIVPLAFSFVSSAQLEDVYTLETTSEEHLELDWTKIYDSKKVLATQWNPSGELLQSDGAYEIETNGRVFWETVDALYFANTKAAFNRGSDSVLTVKTTISEWDGAYEAGIMLRKDLSVDSEAILCSLRDSSAYILWRDEKGAFTQYVSTSGVSTKFNEEKIHLKVTIEKGRGVVTFSCKTGGDINEDTGWRTLIQKSIKFLRNSLELYTGVQVGTQSADKSGRCLFENFSVNYQAPADAPVEDGSESGDDGNGTAPPTVDLPDLPEDLEASGDALLYETFTDFEMFPDEEQVSISNPFWDVRKGKPTIKTNEAETNAYLSVDIVDDPLFVTAGDMTWSDYSVQMDLVFPNDVIITETNAVSLLFRHRAALVGGAGDYCVTLENLIKEEFEGQYLKLRYRGASNSWTGGYNVLESVCVSEDTMLELNKTHTIKVEVIDNKIKIYLNDMSTPIINYEDTNIGSVEQDPHLRGCVGFLVENAAVQIDNLVVRKINDPLGGDYDNDIMGNYDQPIPDWLAKKYYKEQE